MTTDRRRQAEVRSTRSRKAQAAEAREMRRSDAALAAEARRLTATFTRIRNLHRGDVRPAVAPTAPLGVLNERAIRAKHRKAALAGIPRTDRARRAAAKAQAKAPADQEIAAARMRMEAERDAAQARLDVAWAELLANEPSAVLRALRQSYEDSDMPASAVAVRGDEVALAVLVPDPATVPAKLAVTDAGRMALRALTPAESAAQYRELVCGHLLAAVRQAFAAAPGIASARAVVLRSAGPDAYGQPTADCLLVAQLTRTAFEGVRWAEADASRIVVDTSTDLLTNPGPHSARLEPIDLAGRPGLAALIANVDLARLASPRQAQGGPCPSCQAPRLAARSPPVRRHRGPTSPEQGTPAWSGSGLEAAPSGARSSPSSPSSCSASSARWPAPSRRRPSSPAADHPPAPTEHPPSPPLTAPAPPTSRLPRPRSPPASPRAFPPAATTRPWSASSTVTPWKSPAVPGSASSASTRRRRSSPAHPSSASAPRPPGTPTRSSRREPACDSSTTWPAPTASGGRWPMSTSSTTACS